jgi:hypothetical protein
MLWLNMEFGKWNKRGAGAMNAEWPLYRRCGRLAKLSMVR